MGAVREQALAVREIRRFGRLPGCSTACVSHGYFLLKKKNFRTGLWNGGIKSMK